MGRAMYERYFEVPYLLNGRAFEGADCYGLVILWYREELGIALDDPVNDLKTFKDADSRNLFLSHIGDCWVRVDEPERHDVALIKNGSTNPNHTAVILDSEWMLQTLEGPGCHRARLCLWRPKVYRFYRHKRLMP